MWLSSGSALSFGGLWTQAAPEGQNWLVGDFNGDGKDDLIDAQGRVLVSTGTSFVDAGRFAGIGDGSIAAIDDIDGDGKDDLVVRGSDGALSLESDPLSRLEPGLVIADQSNGQPALAMLGDEIAVSVVPAGADMSYRFTLVDASGANLAGTWSDLPQARFRIDKSGIVGVMVEIRDKLTGELTSRQYATNGTTVRDPAVVADVLDLGRFTIAEYAGDLSFAASEQAWRSGIGSFDDLYAHAASAVAAADAPDNFSSAMAQATGFLQFVSGLWGLGEFDGSPGGVMANVGLGVTAPQDASVDTYLDSTVGLCTDYASILALFLTKAGYENRVISGAGHIFNEVMIDGQWWVFDAMVGMALKGTIDEVLDTGVPTNVMLFENAQSDPSSSVFRPSNTDSHYLLNWYHNSVSPGNYRYNSIDFLRSLPYGAIFDPALDLSGWTPTTPTGVPGHEHPDAMSIGEFVSIVSRQRLELQLIDDNVSAQAAETGWRQDIDSFTEFAARVDAMLLDHFDVAQLSDVPMEDRARFYARFVSGLWQVDENSGSSAGSTASWDALLAADTAGTSDLTATLAALFLHAGLSPVVRSTGSGLVVEIQVGGATLGFDPVSAMNFIGGWNAAADTSKPASIEVFHSVALQGDRPEYSAYAAGLRYDLLSLLAGGLIAPSQPVDALTFLAGTILAQELDLVEELQEAGAPRILTAVADRPIADFATSGTVSFDVVVNQTGLALTVEDFAATGGAGVVMSVVAMGPLTWRVTIAAAGATFGTEFWLASAAGGQLATAQQFDADAAGSTWSPGIGQASYVGGVGVDTLDFSGQWESPTGVDVDLTTGQGKGGFAEGDSYASIDAVIGTSRGDRIRGSASDEILAGGAGGDILLGEAGNDQLLGGDGNDRLNGGAGADFIDGAGGNDTTDYGGNFGGVWVDLATGAGRWNWAHEDTLIGIENVVGTSYGDWLYGSSDANRLYGGDGDDRLNGGMGADLLDGGTGEDTADYTGNFGGVWIDLGAGTGQGNWAHGDTLTGIENVRGTAWGDWLYGSSGTNKLYGGDGNDRLSGGAGADLLDGGVGEDTADYTGNFGAVWIDLAAGTGQWNWAHGDTLTGIENVYGTSWGDWLYGSSGTNKLYGEEGNDRLSGGAGADLLDGGLGEDTADYTGNFGAVWIDLATGTGQWNWAHGDTLAGIENVVGTSYGDWLYGSSGANKLYGGAGDDRLSGGAGADVIDGGTGQDTADYNLNYGAVWIDLATGTGQWNWAHGDTLTGIENVVGTSYGDWLYGSSDANRLYGGDGDDRLVGGAGADLLDGGTGEDTADYSGNYGAVWIDLAAGTGTWNWAHGDALTGIENVTGTTYGDRLYGSSGANKLNGGGGDDWLMGGGGADLIDGGAGTDVALYAGLEDDYELVIQAGQVIVRDKRPDIDGDDGEDVLIDVETIRFKDGSEVSLVDMALAGSGAEAVATNGAGSIASDTAALRLVHDIASFAAMPANRVAAIHGGFGHSAMQTIAGEIY